jgi:PAS domain S-box-containing protein
MRFAHNGITPSAPERFLCHEVDSYSFMNPKVRKNAPPSEVQTRLDELDLYRSALNHVSDITYLLDVRQGKLLKNTARFAGGQIERMTGYSAEELTRKPGLWFSLIHPDDVLTMLPDSADMQQPIRREIRLRHKDTGEVHPLAEVLTPQRDSAGQIIRLIGIARDITERRQMEDQLRKLSSAVEQSPAVILITDTQGKIEYVNPAFTAITGFTSEEAIGQMPRILKSGETPDEQYKDLWQTLSRGETWEGELLNRSKTGQLFWMRERISPLRDTEGRITHYLAVEEDITERKRTEVEAHLLLLLTQQIESASSLEAMTRIAIQQVCEYTGWEIGEAWIPNEQRTLLEYAPECSFLSDEGNPAWRAFARRSAKMTFAAGEGLPGRVWMNKRPEWEHDVSQLLEHLFLRAKLAKRAGLKSALGVPVMTGSGVLLAVLVFYMSVPRPSDQRMIDLISSVVAQLGSIIQRKLVEDALRASEERYRSLFNGVPIGLYRSTAEGRLLDVNQAEADMLGYDSVEELMQTHAADLYVEPETRQRWQADLKPSDTIFHVFKHLRRKEGAQIWVQDTGRIVRNSAGQVEYYEGALIDVTRRKLAEDALIQSEQKYRELIEQASDGIVMFDRQGRLLEANAATCAMLGHNKAELLTMKVQDVLRLSVAELAQFAEQFSALRVSTPVRAEIDLYRADHTLMQVEVSINLLPNGHVQALLHDITRRKQIQQVEREQHALAETLHSISITTSSTLDPDKVLDSVLEHVDKLISHQDAAILLDRGSTFLRRHQIDVTLSIPTADLPILADLMEAQSPILVEDIRHNPEYKKLCAANHWGNFARSLLIAPIRVDQKAIGLLLLTHPQPAYFQTQHAAHIATLLAQVSIALTNAHLYATEQRGRVIAEALRHSAESLASTVQMESTLESIIDQLGKLIHYDRTMLLLFEKNRIRLAIERGFSQHNRLADTGIELLKQTPIFDPGMSGKFIYIPDVHTDEAFASLVKLDQKVHSWVSLPLMASGVILGVLLVGSVRLAAFTPADLAVMKDFGIQVSLAVRNRLIITHLEESLSELAQAQEKLRRSARLSAAGEIASGVAHQINNPLTAIIGRVHILMAELDPGSPAYATGSAIQQAAYRAGAIVQRMLDLARETQYTMLPVKINDSIQSALSLVQTQLDSSSIQLRLNLAADLPEIMGSDQHLQDVWLNLLLNARDAMQAARGKKVIKIATRLNDRADRIEIEIQNNGAGFPEESYEKLFTPFVTTKQHGTGLGLAICLEVVTRHQGTIELTSQPGEAACFLISLPVARA